MMECSPIFDSFNSLKVVVAGDVMLDTYMWGTVERISPEAPVPVVSVHRKEQRIGGAGNVALNCRSLGASVFIVTMTGDDPDAKLLERLFQESDIDTSGLIKSKKRITTNKTRVISRNQQMMRLDSEITREIDEEEEDRLIMKLKNIIELEDPDILIFEDYDKGVLSDQFIHNAVVLCGESGVLTTADPKKRNFFSYRNVDIFKPNMREVRDALNLSFDLPDPGLLSDIHKKLKEKLQHGISLITLSEKGIFYDNGKNSAVIPSHLRNIADVSGAGDTVIAVASMVYAITRNMHQAAEIANIAGGMVCEEVGTVAINKEKFLAECEMLLS